VPEAYKPSNKHKAYIFSLKELNLHKTALGNEWIKSSERALASPIRMDTPFEEAFYLDPSQAEALGYRFSVMRGQKLLIEVFSYTADSVILFMDLFRIVDDSLNYWNHVASADGEINKLAFEARQNSDYIIRLQPELLRGGKYSITIRKVPSLVFPVAGKDSRAIGSFYGDPRDGGRRDHHGVDIFANRHTPIIAPTKGYVRFVGERNLGGNVIWLSDAQRGQTLYFAHLQEQLVQENTWVEAGDTIGTVGNTGNARRTPTHLHFGIYNRGPQDPLYFIKETKLEPDSISVDQELFGFFARSVIDQLYTPNSSQQIKPGNLSDTVKTHQVFKIIGGFKNYYKVQLPNQKVAYLHNRFVESVNSPIDEQIIKGETAGLLDEPSSSGISKETIKEGEQISVLGHFSDFWWIQTANGSLGWLPKYQIAQ
jgi:murein DD-endopeptidase MepM/ murein hydrolase activator NlpD